MVATIDNPTCLGQQTLIPAAHQIVLVHANQSLGLSVTGLIASP